jgi:hypothetical protein
MDIAAYCVENPGQPAPNTLGNCPTTPQSTPGGEVTLNTTPASCGQDGSVSSGGTVTATLAGVNDYQAVCYASPTGIKCTITDKQ